MLLLVVVACQGTLESVELDLGATRSFVAFYVEGAQVVDVLAADVPAGETFAALPRRPGAAIHTVEVSCTLAEAGLSAGHQLPITSGGVPLRRSLRTRRGDAERMRQGEWESTSLPELLASVRLPGQAVSPCHRYSLEDFDLGRDGFGAALVGGSSGPPRLVIRTERGFERYDPATRSLVDILPLPADAPPRIYFGATVNDASGAGYFFSSLGDYLRVTPDGAVTHGGVTTSSTLARSARPFTSVAVPRSGDIRSDVFMTTEQGRQEHFDGAQWITLSAAPPKIFQATGAVWIGPGQALLVTGRTANEILIADGAEKHAEAVFPEGTRSAEGALRQIEKAVWIEALQAPAALDGVGGIWVREGTGTYRSLLERWGRDDPNRAVALYSRGSHIVYAGGGHLFPVNVNDKLLQVDLELGVCDETLALGLGQTTQFFAVGEQDLIAYGARRNSAGKASSALQFLGHLSGPVRCD